MTIEELEQQIKVIQDEIDKLKSEQTKGGIKPWRGYMGEKYWYVYYSGEVFKETEKQLDYNNMAYSFGNYYRTEALAEQDRNEIALRNKVRQLRDVLCEEYKFVPYGDNYTICLDTIINTFYISSRKKSSKNIGEIYFDTEEHAQQACDILNRELKNGNIKI